MKPFLFISRLFVLNFLVVPVATAATFTEFDAPGAGTGSGQGTLAYQINSSSEVVGYYIDSQYNDHGFVRARDGTFTTFDVKGTSTWPAEINDHGMIGGAYDVLLKQRDIFNGFLRTARGKIEVVDPPRNRWGASIDGINLGGTSAGSYADANGVHGFVRSEDSRLTEFDAPGATDTDARAINDGGTIVGSYWDGDQHGVVEHGFLRAADGTFTEFDAPDASGGTTATAINREGWVVGQYDDANTDSHGYLRHPEGTFTKYDAPDAGKAAYQGTLGGEITSHANIAGGYIDSNNVEHGYIRLRNGSLTEFDAPDAAYGTVPGGINDGDVVSGYYQDAGGVYHGFLRTPQTAVRMAVRKPGATDE
jgi:uncharacterized membrane protein